MGLESVNENRKCLEKASQSLKRIKVRIWKKMRWCYWKLTEGDSFLCTGREFSNSVVGNFWTIENVPNQLGNVTKISNQC